MFKRKRGRKAKKGLFSRLFRSGVAVVILTAFVLGISLGVKELATLDTQKALSFTDPYLEKVGVSSEKAGEVAGALVQRAFSTNISPSPEVSDTNISDNKEVFDPVPSIQAKDDKEIVLTLAVMSDSHNDNEALAKALAEAKELDADAVIHLGDFTDFGEEKLLREAKVIMDLSDLDYYVLPGDRDLYESVGTENFVKVFGNYDKVIKLNGVSLGFLDNSANFTVIPAEEYKEFTESLKGMNFVFLSQPIFHSMASYGKPTQGLVQGEEVPEVKEQAEDLLRQIRSSRVFSIIAGDHHEFSESEDPLDEELRHITVTSVSDDKASRGVGGFGLLRVFDDNSFDFTRITIN